MQQFETGGPDCSRRLLNLIVDGCDGSDPSKKMGGSLIESVSLPLIGSLARRSFCIGYQWMRPVAIAVGRRMTGHIQLRRDRSPCCPAYGVASRREYRDDERLYLRIAVGLSRPSITSDDQCLS